MNSKKIFTVLLLCLLLVSLNWARNKADSPILLQPEQSLLASRPPFDFRVHNIGTLWNTVTNHGSYGDLQGNTPSMEWPGGSGADYLFIGGLWISAKKGSEIAVSQFMYGNNIEWQPSESSAFEFAPQKSNLDSYVMYDDLLSSSGHVPLGLQVSQRALTWNAPGFDDFIAYEYAIVNIGDEILTDLFVGWYYDGDVGTGVDETMPGIDDLVDYDGWHSAYFTDWHGLSPNLITNNGAYIDIVENIDKNFNNVLDGYDEYGVPFGDPYNPRHDPSKIHPDGFPDEWQVFVTTNDDTILVPRGISFMYDGDDPETEEDDTGEFGAVTGYIGGRLLYTSLAPFHETADDTLPRIHTHLYRNWEQDLVDDQARYNGLAGRLSDQTILSHPFSLELPAFDYRFLNSTGPFIDFAPGDTLYIVYAAAVSQGLMGLRGSLDNALVAYYSGSEHSDPAHPSNPVADYHWEIAGPPIAKDIRALPVFVESGLGTVKISARVYDIDGTVAEVQAKIHYRDGSLVTTLPMVDDGTQGDEVANDDTYTCTWPVSAENFFTVSLYSRDNDGNEVTREKVARFTSAGPVRLKNVQINADDPAASPLLDTYFQVELENLGQTLAIDNMVVKIKTTDKMVTQSRLPLLYPASALQPGSASTCDTELMFYVADDCPNGHVVEFEAEIQSNNYIYWRDTFSITVVDDKPPWVRDVLGDRFCNPGEAIRISFRVGKGAGVKEARADIRISDAATVASLNLVNNQDDLFEAEWVTPAAPQAYDVNLYLCDNLDNAFTNESIAGFITESFVSANRILLVDNDNYNYPSHSTSKRPYVSYYTEALDSIAVLYDVYSVYFYGPVTTTLLEAYRKGIVIWETGDTRTGDSAIRSKSALEPAEQAALMHYLDQGGTLFLSGQGTTGACAENSIFFSDYLGVSILTPDIDRRNLLLVADEPISDGIRPRLTGGTGANNQAQIASLLPLNEQTLPVFTYPNQEAAAVKVMHESNTRIVYFAFGFESISATTQRTTLMSRIVESLMATKVEPARVGTSLPRTFALHQNYPNPFNPMTTIRYDVPKTTRVKIQVLNLLGQQVAILADKQQSAGTYEIHWEAGGFSSGIYLIRFETDDCTFQRKMLLLK